MKVFLVHAFKDFTEDTTLQDTKISYQAFKEILYFFNPEVKLFYLKKRNKMKGVLWKEEARKKIKESNIVLYIDSSTESEYIRWELKAAYDLEKTIITLNFTTLKKLLPFYLHIKRYLEANRLDMEEEVKQEDVKDIFPSHMKYNEKRLNEYFKNEYNSFRLKFFLKNIHSFIDIESSNEPPIGFHIHDDFSGDQRRIDMEVYISQFQEIAKEKIGMQGLQMNENEEFKHLQEAEKMQLLLEQYKIFVHSSETLMQRRQAINSFYVTANTVLVALFAAVVALKDISHL